MTVATSRGSMTLVSRGNSVPRAAGAARAPRADRATRPRALASTRAAVTANLPAPIATLGRGASMDGLGARVRSRRSRVRGDDSRRRRSRRFGVFLFIRPRDDGDGASSAPRPAGSATAAAAAALAGASRGGCGRASRGCGIVGRGVDDARVTGSHRLIALSSPPAPWSPSQSFCPGRPDARRSTSPRWRACVAAAALVAPRPHAATGVGVHSDGKTGEREDGVEQNAFVAAAGRRGKSRRRAVRRKRRWRCVGDGLRGEERACASEGGGEARRTAGRPPRLASRLVRGPSELARGDEERSGETWTRRVALHLASRVGHAGEGDARNGARATTVVARAFAARRDEAVAEAAARWP